MVRGSQTRRTHRKSRNGCRNCKRRRIKCDETHPACQRCGAFEIDCDYQHESQKSSSSSNSSTSPDGCQASLARRPGRPRGEWSTATSSSSVSTGSPTPSIDQAITNVDNVQLMHHFTTNIARTLAPTGRVRQMWQNAIPELSFKQTYLLELLLALSALHFARHSTAQEGRYQLLAHQHESAGLRGLTSAMASMADANATAVYTATTLSCYVYLGKGPRKGDCLVFGEGGIAAWFTMFRGIRSVAELRPNEDYGAILGQMKDREDGYEEGDNPSCLRSSSIESEEGPSTWPKPFKRLRSCLDSHTATNKAMYINTLTSLETIFLQTFGTVDEQALSNEETGHLPFAWLYQLEDEFLHQAQQHAAIPLVVLSFFAVLIKKLEVFWWLRSWAENIVESVKHLIAEEHHELIEWPVHLILGTGHDTVMGVRYG